MENKYPYDCFVMTINNGQTTLIIADDFLMTTFISTCPEATSEGLN